MKTTHYTFKAKREEIDLDRIWQEAPQGTRLVTVDGADHWYFMVVRSIYDLAFILDMPILIGTYQNSIPKIKISGALEFTNIEERTDYVFFAIAKNAKCVPGSPFATPSEAFKWLARIDERVNEKIEVHVTSA